MAVKHWFHIICGTYYLRRFRNNDLFSHITLARKKIIYNAMKADKKPHIQQVIRDIESIYYVERYKASLKIKHILCDKKWTLIWKFIETNKAQPHSIIIFSITIVQHGFFLHTSLVWLRMNIHEELSSLCYQYTKPNMHRKRTSSIYCLLLYNLRKQASVYLGVYQHIDTTKQKLPKVTCMY